MAELPKPEWGIYPEDFTPRIYWGARAIISEGFLDLLPDRQSFQSEADVGKNERDEFMMWVNKHALPHLNERVKKYDTKNVSYSNQDGRYQCVARDRNSGGYLYIGAYARNLYMAPFFANLREHLIFGRSYDYANYEKGGACRFEGLTFEVAMNLIKWKFLPPDDRQNDSPTAQEFVGFMEQHNPENWVLNGYVISPLRKDVRVSIEGIDSIGPLTDHDMADFLRTFRDADSLYAEDGEPVSCWYD